VFYSVFGFVYSPRLFISRAGPSSSCFVWLVLLFFLQVHVILFVDAVAVVIFDGGTKTCLNVPLGLSKRRREY
jgi:hypothetical protein